MSRIFTDTPWPSSAPKDRNQGVKDRGIWWATSQDHTHQFKPPETDDPYTGALGNQNKVELHLAGMLLRVETYGPPCISIIAHKLPGSGS